MLDPYTYLLLHKYQKRELLRQAELDRLVSDNPRRVIQKTRLTNFSHMIVRWWTQHRRAVRDNRLADGKVVMP